MPRERGGAGRRGADGAGEARRAEAAEELGVVGVLREQAVRSAVVERSIASAPARALMLAHFRGDQVERFVPGNPREIAAALGALADGRVLEAVFAIDVVREPPHFSRRCSRWSANDGGRHRSRRLCHFRPKPRACSCPDNRADRPVSTVLFPHRISRSFDRSHSIPVYTVRQGRGRPMNSRWTSRLRGRCQMQVKLAVQNQSDPGGYG